MSFYLGYHNCSLSAVGFVESNEFGKWVFANDIAVEDKERLAGAVDKLVSSQSQRASRS